VVACPCALVISTPVSIVAALATAARRGVLIKGGAHLERLAAVRVVAFDKTGTLTTGTPMVGSVTAVGNGDGAEALAVAAAVERRSAHPIADAIVAAARERAVDEVEVTDVRERPGFGAEARWHGVRVAVGNAALAAEHGVSAPDAARYAAECAGRGEAPVFVLIDSTLRLVAGIGDRVRPVAADVVRLLREHGIAHVALLTGDTPDAASALARATHVTDVRASLLPADKLHAVRELREAFGSVAMVGDGVNDAPALAAADVGIAMGAAGSAAALEAADVALMSDELQKLPYALRLSRATLANVRTNVALSIGLKAAVLALAVAGWSTLWMAVLADTGASVLVVANAMRLLRHS
jgi:Cd2+/Zn2+-exporting ATPase